MGDNNNEGSVDAYDKQPEADGTWTLVDARTRERARVYGLEIHHVEHEVARQLVTNLNYLKATFGELPSIEEHPAELGEGER